MLITERTTPGRSSPRPPPVVVMSATHGGDNNSHHRDSQPARTARARASSPSLMDTSDNSGSHRRPPASPVSWSMKKSTIASSPVTPRSVAATSETPPIPFSEEQAIFEERLTEETGIAIRKLNPVGKVTLRNVRCITLEDSKSVVSNKSGRFLRRGLKSQSSNHTLTATGEPRRALTWGKKKDICIPLSHFVSVRTGKQTARTQKCNTQANRLLSIVAQEATLDMEAPTQQDRDKFARAFAHFLNVPILKSEDDARSVQSAVPPPATSSVGGGDANSERWSEPGLMVKATSSIPQKNSIWLPPLPPKATTSATAAATSSNHTPNTDKNSSTRDATTTSPMVSVVRSSGDIQQQPPLVSTPNCDTPDIENEEDDHVSSLTGHGYDQELVEELHQALTDLRVELDEARAEAARAVKVAEHAIQSAERSDSSSHNVEWQNTVTHKAAAAAAAAQQRSAQALASQRRAEERLAAEKQSSQFWRHQAAVAEDEAGRLQTAAAAANVQRKLTELQLESSRRLAATHATAWHAQVKALEERHERVLEEAWAANRGLEEQVRQVKKKPQIKGTAAVTSSNDQQQLLQLYAKTSTLRSEFDHLRRTTAHEISQLPNTLSATEHNVSMVAAAASAEISRLQNRLALETASRRKLLHQVQDLKGYVRVYCRPRSSVAKGILSLPSQETVVVESSTVDLASLTSTAATGTNNTSVFGTMTSFEFDRVFDMDSIQEDVYAEVENVCLGALDGFTICVMGYGQTGCGKTHTLLGDVNVTEDQVEIVEHGILMKTAQQLFAIADHRCDRYDDRFMLSIVEVHNGRLSDLLAGTEAGEKRGEIIMADSKNDSKVNFCGRSSRSSKKSIRSADDSTGDDVSNPNQQQRQTKLEIRTDLHGDTVVQGSLQVPVTSFEELNNIWTESLAIRAQRLYEQDIDIGEYEASSHVIATLKVMSSNIATGTGTVGKLQFCDLAGSDLIEEKSTAADGVPTPSTLMTFQNDGLQTLSDVVEARSQFSRSVPYRNSTLTHLLRDSLESDTKVLLFACVSNDEEDLQETLSTLRFAARMRRVNIGKATQHRLTPP